MTIENIYNSILCDISKKLTIQQVLEWDSYIPFKCPIDHNFTESEYYNFAAEMIVEYTALFESGELSKYMWKKHMLAVIIMLADL